MQAPSPSLATVGGDWVNIGRLSHRKMDRGKCATPIRVCRKTAANTASWA